MLSSAFFFFFFFGRGWGGGGGGGGGFFHTPFLREFSKPLCTNAASVELKPFVLAVSILALFKNYKGVGFIRLLVEFLESSFLFAQLHFV